MVSTPKAPDPYATAAAQGQINKQTAIQQSELNNVNQITPYGSVTYKQTGTGADGIPTFTATTQLSEPMQNLVNSNISNAQGSSNLEGQLQGNAASTLSQPLNLGWNATEANLDQLGRNTIDPQIQQQQNQMNQQLADQGITPGSEAWNTAQTNFNNSRAAAYNNLYLQGHNTAVNDLEAQYNSPLNALNALRSGSQVSQPGVGQTAQTAQTGIQPANLAGLVEQNYQNQVANSSASMGGMFGLGGALLGGLTNGGAGGFGASLLGGLLAASDETMKTDIKKLGKDPESGLTMYAYRYKGDPKSYPKTVGPMAQEIEKLDPSMIHHFGGKKVVEMRGAVGRAFGMGGRA